MFSTKTSIIQNKNKNHVITIELLQNMILNNMILNNILENVIRSCHPHFGKLDSSIQIIKSS